jgi:hypothetical protein
MTTIDFTPITRARELAHDAERALEALEPKVTGSTDALEASIRRARSAAADAGQQLTHPTFQIAAVGTTNAGKSTLLNGLAGRMICPMNVGEMSAGLLTIRHAQQWSFEAENSPPPTFVEASEKRVYGFLKERMLEDTAQRHAATGDAAGGRFARYRVGAPLLPGTAGHTFHDAFDGRLGLTVLDLPGLRTIDDPANLEVIQDTVKRAFPLVMVDWNALHDREKRQKLLEEVGEALRELDARESMVLFLLNKVDAWNPTDTPVRVILEELTEEFKQALDFAAAELIPVSGACIFGGGRLLMTEGTPGEEAIIHAMHHAPFVQRTIKATIDAQGHGASAWRTARRRLRELEDALDDGVPPNEGDITWFAQECLAAGGGDHLWKALLTRMQAHTAPLIVHPATQATRGALGDVSRSLDAYIDGRVAGTLADVEARCADIARTRALIDAALAAQRVELSKRVSALHEVVGATVGRVGAESEGIEAVLAELGITASEHPALFNVRGTMTEVLGKLRSDVLRPVTDAMAEFKPGSQVAAALVGRPSAPLQSALSDAWNELRACDLYTKSVAAEGLDQTYDRDKLDDDGVRAAGAAYTDVLMALREVMSLEGDRFLRSQSVALRRELREWTERVGVEAWRGAAALVASQVEAAPLQPDMSAAELDLPAPSLPPEMLAIGRPKIKHDSSRSDTRTVWKKREVMEGRGSCRDDQRVVKNVQESEKYNVPTVRVVLPSGDTIHDQVMHAMSAHGEHFWAAYLSWLEDALLAALGQVDTLAARALDAAESGLEARRHEIEEDGQSQVARWEALREDVHALRGLQRELNVLSGASA